MSERKRIYLCLAHMSEDGAEQRYVKEAFDTNWVVPLGPNVNGFEKDLEEFVNSGSGFTVGKEGCGAERGYGCGASGIDSLWRWPW